MENVEIILLSISVTAHIFTAVTAYVMLVENKTKILISNLKSS